MPSIWDGRLKSRRGFLSWLAFSLFGALAAGSVFVGSDILSKMTDVAVPLLRVKVVYNLMARYLNESEEYFAFRSPAYLRDLMREIAAKHPSLSMMVGPQPTMVFLVDGTPSQPSTMLRDGGQIDLMPLFDGG